MYRYRCPGSTDCLELIGMRVKCDQLEDATHRFTAWVGHADVADCDRLTEEDFDFALVLPN